MDFLDIAIEVTFCSSLAFFALQFVVGLVDRHKHSKPQSHLQYIVPFQRKSKPAAIDWGKLSPYQLRKKCQSRGIRWRNANVQNKHLSKQQMIVALQSAA